MHARNDIIWVVLTDDEPQSIFTHNTVCACFVTYCLPYVPQGPWDTTDPSPLNNGGPVNWFNTSDGDCTDPTLSVNRIACEYTTLHRTALYAI